MITLATLEQATKQEVFDQVAKHLLTQMKRSTKDGGCLYYGPDGLKCAAGCLIAPEEYKSVMDEGDSTAWCALIDKKLVPDYHSELIGELQSIHDHREIEEWKMHLSILAERKSLQFKIEEYEGDLCE